jgi:DNA helicase-2/ATP-dependent DNA helicase PcrA
VPITPQQIRNAQARQHQAAHDASPQVRLIAGPGTGKSFAIGERVRWLLETGIPPHRIYVVSFTRAASLDLRRRVHKYCHERNFPNADEVSVSTLHSLALKALSAANLLAYPARPLVMDSWELQNIFDAEFSRASGYTGRAGTGYTPGRCGEIRRDYEAFCGTGQWLPPNFIPPDPPISQTERADYQGFHRLRTQVYSCVLPGEIIRQCVENMQAGTLDPVALLGVEHLVVDEYQDLNPIDLQFIDELVVSGVTTFVAGDDDQSIYSFRFASPQGIQSFTDRHPHAGDHELQHCFRCTPTVLEAACTLLEAFPEPGRVRKHIVSLYATADPPELGVVHRWRFPSAVREARAIAESCRALTDRDFPPRKLMILVSNTRAQLSTLTSALQAEDVEFESPRADSFIDTRAGRFVLALLRIVCDTSDYVAHRLLLGSRPNVGPGICNGIAEDVIANNLNFRDIFYHPVPRGIFRGRQLSALNSARHICGSIANWLPTETLSQRCADISNTVSTVFGQQEARAWEAQIAHLPQDMTLEEVRDYLWADTDEQQMSLLEAVYARLSIPVPEEGFLPQKVRIMTMHGAKGLDGSVVFIPGLMEEILPGDRKRLYPGLVLEAARMLYVSITRGRAACILSYAETRVARGQFSGQTRSRFVPHLGGRFEHRDAGLSDTEVEHILRCWGNL